MNSKTDARLEAVKAAANVKGVDIDNIVEISEKIANFIIGDAELPDVYDPTAMFKDVLEKSSSSNRDFDKINKEIMELLEQRKKENTADGVGK